MTRIMSVNAPTPAIIARTRAEIPSKGDPLVLSFHWDSSIHNRRIVRNILPMKNMTPMIIIPDLDIIVDFL